MLANLLQPENAESPMLVNPTGNEIDVKLPQLANALFPTFVIQSGRDTELSLLQLLNTPLSIVVIEFGQLNVVSPEYLNADEPIDLTESGITIDFRLLQDAKAFEPMLDNLFDNVTDDN